MSPDKMVHMANQIAIFFESRPEPEAVAGVAAHINDFWEPRMRRQLLDHVAAGGRRAAPSRPGRHREDQAPESRLKAD